MECRASHWADVERIKPLDATWARTFAYAGPIDSHVATCMRYKLVLGFATWLPSREATSVLESICDQKVIPCRNALAGQVQSIDWSSASLHFVVLQTDNRWS